MEAPTLSELQDFTFNYYTKLLKHLANNYRITPFCDVRYEDTPYLILRHDIDVSLSAALTMAEIEKELGIRSTYFVLLSSQFYNVLEGENLAILKKISGFGHEIGLHYHPAQYTLYKQSPQKTLQIETQLLEQFLGKKVHSIARHGLWDRDPFAATRQYINANHPYLRADLFVHDSNRAWVTLEGLSTLLANKPKRVQLLIHADNWQEDKIDREKLLERHVQTIENKIHESKKSLIENMRTDQNVIDYENAKTNANFNRPDYKRVSGYQSNYNRLSLIRYYLIHTKIGWNSRKLRNRVENKYNPLYSTKHLPPQNNLAVKSDLAESPLVSIIITSYNYGHYLSDAIESALNQTYPNTEIVVVDDGSKDNTKDVAGLYPVKYILESHQGVSSARNMGIKLSRGKYFICLDGDDKLFSNYVEATLSEMLKNSSTGFVLTGSKVWNEIFQTQNIWMPRRLFSKYSLFTNWHGALGPALFRKKAFESLSSGYDPSYLAYEDLDLCFRLLAGGWKSGLVSEPLHWYRVHRDSQNPSTFEKRKEAEAFIDSKFWFRRPYREFYALYEGTAGRVESLIRHPVTYVKGLQKKIQVISKINSCSKTIIPGQEAQGLENEIFLTIDMMIEWDQNKQLRKYYAKRLEILESKLNSLCSSPSQFN